MHDSLVDKMQSQPFVVGKCELMCPSHELRMRETEGLIHLLETDPSLYPERRRGQYLKGDPKRAVKCYQRSAAGMQLQNAKNLRPIHVLSQTVTHLLTTVMDDKRMPWCVRYSFIFDRLRAVKQDLIIQQPKPVDCIKVLEPMVRFHVVAAYCGIWNDNLTEGLTQSTSDFCPVLNRKQLNECLKYLLSLYDEVGNAQCQARQQMEALYQLLYLGEVEALLRGITLPHQAMSKEMQCALKLSIAWYNRQYATVLKTSKNLSLFLQMAFTLSLPRIRRYALDVMNTAYSSKNLRFPLEIISEQLLFQNCAEAKLSCEYFGVNVSEDKVLFSKGTFCGDKQEIPFTGVKYIDDALKQEQLCNLLLSHNGMDDSLCNDINSLSLIEE